MGQGTKDTAWPSVHGALLAQTSHHTCIMTGMAQGESLETCPQPPVHTGTSALGLSVVDMECQPKGVPKRCLLPCPARPASTSRVLLPGSRHHPLPSCTYAPPKPHEAPSTFCSQELSGQTLRVAAASAQMVWGSACFRPGDGILFSPPTRTPTAYITHKKRNTCPKCHPGP